MGQLHSDCPLSMGQLFSGCPLSKGQFKSGCLRSMGQLHCRRLLSMGQMLYTPLFFFFFLHGTNEPGSALRFLALFFFFLVSFLPYWSFQLFINCILMLVFVYWFAPFICLFVKLLCVCICFSLSYSVCAFNDYI